MTASPPPLRTVTAVYPSQSHPRRGHFIEELHRALADSFQSEILAPQVFREDPLSEHRYGMLVTRFPYPSRGRLPRDAPPSKWTVLRYLASGVRASRKRWRAADAARGGLVLGHWVVPSGWIAARTAQRLRLPLVLYGHGSDLHVFAQRRGARGRVAALLRGAVRVIAASSELAARGAEISGRSVEEFDVIPVGVGKEFQSAAELPPAPPPWRLLFVGDLIVEKGLDLLVEAVTRLSHDGVSIALEVVGRGPLDAALRSNAGGPIDVRGELDAVGVRNAMARAHFLVLPTRHEGTPLVVQEALRMNLPIVATAVGGIPELFRKRHGWIRLSSETGVEELVAVLARALAGDWESWTLRRQAMEDNRTDDLTVMATARRTAPVLAEALAARPPGRMEGRR